MGRCSGQEIAPGGGGGWVKGVPTLPMSYVRKFRAQGIDRMCIMGQPPEAGCAPQPST